jgi:hypothetical protein
MIDPKIFATYLEKRYQGQINYYEDKSGKNQKKYKFFQWSLIILSTLTTILAALPKMEGFKLEYVIVFTSAVVTILTSALKTFQYQELWVTYRSTIERLKPEIYYYTFNVGDYGQPGIDKETLFVTRVEGILGKEHEAWPIYKQLMNASGKPGQEDDALQRKLDELLRQRFNTGKQKPEDVKNPGEDKVDDPNENKPADEVIEPPTDEPTEPPTDEPKDTKDETGEDKAT